jgi:hypothetical protein
VCAHTDAPAGVHADAQQEVRGGLFLVDLAGSERLSKVCANPAHRPAPRRHSHTGLHVRLHQL